MTEENEVSGASATPTAALVNQARSGLGPDGLRPTGEEGITATQIVMGHGFVDVGPIYFGDRKGIILRPRPRHIPLGEHGELSGDYWPIPGDVVIWIDNAAGADAILEHLAPFGSESATIKDGPEVKRDGE